MTLSRKNHLDYIYCSIEVPNVYPNDYYMFTKNGYANLIVNMIVPIDNKLISIDNTCLLTLRGLKNGGIGTIYSDSAASSYFTIKETNEKLLKKYFRNKNKLPHNDVILIEDKYNLPFNDVIKKLKEKSFNHIDEIFSDTFTINDIKNNSTVEIIVDPKMVIRLKNTLSRSFNKIERILNSKTNKKYSDYVGNEVILQIDRLNKQIEIENLRLDLQGKLSVNTPKKILHKI